MKIFKVRNIPPELQKESRSHVVHLVDENNVRRPIFPKQKVTTTKQQGAPGWCTVKVYE